MLIFLEAAAQIKEQNQNKMGRGRKKGALWALDNFCLSSLVLQRGFVTAFGSHYCLSVGSLHFVECGYVMLRSQYCCSSKLFSASFLSLCNHAFCLCVCPLCPQLLLNPLFCSHRHI